MKKKSFHIATRVIHAGQTPDKTTGAIMTPIYATSTYVQKSPGEHLGYEYSRTKNPTRSAYEACMANLESGNGAFAFASGMSAIAAIFELLSPHDHILVSDDVYGGTHRLINAIKTKTSDIQCTYVDMTKPELLKKYLTSRTRLLWIETPTNPMLKLIDLKKMVQFARQHHLLSVVDNTFATPILQRPLELGCDLVVHSATKYLNGHSDMIGGIVVAKNKMLCERLGFIQNAVGAIQSPFDSFLALRGLKTLNIRMQKHCENALALAHWLTTARGVLKVIYPGLPSHPAHLLAKEQMQHFGGMISVILNASKKETFDMLKRCQIFSLAESLGGVESLIEHPASMTHASVAKNIRKKLGIFDNLIRISVGIEAIEDLKRDLTHALSPLARA